MIRAVGRGTGERKPFWIDMLRTGRYNTLRNAGVAQLVEHKLPKLGVAGSSPVARSITEQIPA